MPHRLVSPRVVAFSRAPHPTNMFASPPRPPFTSVSPQESAWRKDGACQSSGNKLTLDGRHLGPGGRLDEDALLQITQRQPDRDTLQVNINRLMSQFSPPLQAPSPLGCRPAVFMLTGCQFSGEPRGSWRQCCRGSVAGGGWAHPPPALTPSLRRRLRRATLSLRHPAD